MTWRSPNTRKSLTLEVKSVGFEPLVVIYTGDSLTELTRVARSQLSSDNKGNTATVSFTAEDGVDYHIAVDGSKGRAGPFTLSLKASTVRPGFTVQPAPATVEQGQIATFSATVAITGDSVRYQWERLPVGSRTWETLADTDIFNGTTTAELSVRTSLSMTKDRFRVKATDSVGPSYSRAVTLTVTEFAAVNTEVLGSVDVEVAGGEVPPPTNGGGYFATGLPRGLTLDPQTGIITGVATSRPGTYRVTYGSTNGKVKNPEQFVLQIIVAPFAPQLVGSFEALLDSVGSPAVPAGKLTVKVAANGSYTGSYFVLADGKAYSFRGTVVLDESTRTAGVPDTTPLLISRGSGRAPLQLAFTLREPPPESTQSATLDAKVYDDNDDVLGQSVNGVALAKFTTLAPAPWAGDYTVRLTDVEQLVPDAQFPLPIGSGHATASVTARSGALALRARLPDNTPFTASLLSSPNGTYRLGQRVHAVGGSIAGQLALTEGNSPGSTLRYHVSATSGSRLYWNKPLSPRDRLYPEGFGVNPLSLTFLMEPWQNPGQNFPGTLGLSSQGNLVLNIVAAKEQDGNYALSGRIHPYELPIDVRIGATGKLILVAPATNPTKFTFKVNPANGTFTGGYQLLGAPGTPSTLLRKVTYSGVLFRPESTTEGDILGEGFAIVPPFGEAEIPSAALIEFRAGPPEASSSSE